MRAIQKGSDKAYDKAKKFLKTHKKPTKSNIVVDIYNKSLVYEKKYDVPAAITTAQACIESSYGKSVPKDIKSGKNSHNLFGIKATKKDIKKNNYVFCYTHEYINGSSELVSAKFTSYKNVATSLQAHARLFKNFYKPKSSFIKKEGKKAWAKSMQNKGYVTDPHYEEQLISFIYYTWNLK